MKLGEDVSMTIIIMLIIKLIRSACGIATDDNELIVTGCRDTTTGTGTRRVSVYNKTGWLRDIASLNVARRYHACGRFRNNDNNMVNANVKSC